MFLYTFFSIISAPHSPGCLPAEASALAGTDQGASVLALVHELTSVTSELFKTKKIKAQTDVVTGIQKKYAISYYCALCFANYAQCVVANCEDAHCGDYSSAECKNCAAVHCGSALLHCTRADVALPTEL